MKETCWETLFDCFNTPFWHRAHARRGNLGSERWLRHLATVQMMATGDNVIGRGLPLVVISQGSGGSFAGWLLPKSDL